MDSSEFGHTDDCPDNIIEGDFLDDILSESVSNATDLNREWKRRHGQLHTMGYHNGITAGKEAAAQEGFTSGYKYSVLVGHDWGFVRGITSAFVSLSDSQKKALLEKYEETDKIQELYDYTKTKSSEVAFEMLRDSILQSDGAQSQCFDEKDFQEKITEDENLSCKKLSIISTNLASLFHNFSEDGSNIFEGGSSTKKENA